MQQYAAYQIRTAHSMDTPSLEAIYRAAIREIGGTRYSRAQVRAWASFPDDQEAFDRWINEAKTVVAVTAANEPIGFGGLEAPARISALFVLPACMRQGVGSSILERLIAFVDPSKAKTLTTQASEYSKPLFEKFGFVVDYIEHTTFKGVEFQRYVMSRPLV